GRRGVGRRLQGECVAHAVCGRHSAFLREPVVRLWAIHRGRGHVAHPGPSHRSRAHRAVARERFRGGPSTRVRSTEIRPGRGPTLEAVAPAPSLHASLDPRNTRRRRLTMAIRLRDEAPDFTAATTNGTHTFPQW